MGYVCIEHDTTPATIIITMLEDGATIGLCGECVHPWAAGIAAATDPEAIQAAKAAVVADGEAERSAELADADPDAPVSEPASVEGWTHPLDRAEAEAEAEAEVPTNHARCLDCDGQTWRLEDGTIGLRHADGCPSVKVLDGVDLSDLGDELPAEV